MNSTAIKSIEGTKFTFKGRIMGSKNGGEEILEEEETAMSFTLNDHVRFRINDKGEIRQVQGYDLEIGKNYHIAYAPYENNPEVEIITMLE